jgi:hypothetical protein
MGFTDRSVCVSISMFAALQDTDNSRTAARKYNTRKELPTHVEYAVRRQHHVGFSRKPYGNSRVVMNTLILMINKTLAGGMLSPEVTETATDADVDENPT